MIGTRSIIFSSTTELETALKLENAKRIEVEGQLHTVSQQLFEMKSNIVELERKLQETNNQSSYLKSDLEDREMKLIRTNNQLYKCQMDLMDSENRVLKAYTQSNYMKTMMNSMMANSNQSYDTNQRDQVFESSNRMCCKLDMNENTNDLYSNMNIASKTREISFLHNTVKVTETTINQSTLYNIR